MNLRTALSQRPAFMVVVEKARGSDLRAVAMRANRRAGQRELNVWDDCQYEVRSQGRRSHRPEIMVPVVKARVSEQVECE